MIVHKLVYYITNILIYFYALNVIASYDKEAALLISVLIIMRFIANELYLYGLRKKDEEVIREMEFLLNMKERPNENDEE